MTTSRTGAPAAATGADVVVVGAGMGGLVVAHELARAGRDVVVVDAAEEVGGLLRRGTLAGVDIDLGAESFATRTDAVAALVADAGLPLELVAPRPQGAWLAVATDDGVCRARLPRRTVLGIPADPGADDVVAIIGADGAARARDERRVPIIADAEPSLYDLVAERLGVRVADRLVDTLCRSVYSRPAAEARLSQLHPGLWREFVSRGSLLEAADAIATGQRAGAAVGGIAGGMWRLPTALAEAAEAHGAKIRTGVAVRAVRSDVETVTVETTSGSLSARQVVIATGPAEAARLLAGAGVSTRAPAAVRLVAAAIAHPALAAEPVGSGVIVDAALPTAAKALTHITAKWDWARAATPDGIHLVRLSARDAAAGTLATADEVAREVSILTGVDVAAADVVDLVVQEWTDAVVGAAAPDDLPAGIHLAGAAAAGTGLASVIPHARDLAARLDRALAASLPSSSLHTHPVS
ncbi:protoporphyrinogen oxidase [Microbacterium laevaniformans]|uniref:FAD-dependent oxidoreductase n=1 Tax=Microbacterium laevaniformans TaxID=36807 RepID=UPI00195BA8B6|nr:FAD-dependent oxidoreductase [Microbacterium laevaniformans]MBM7752984.1 oxygen-dependent protoporphyrinogen oxidase [Microbacterium laevaniformans]GLJ64489.1 protoporphyrinogen oxidase [Microbacterium laevaniformans]